MKRARSLVALALALACDAAEPPRAPAAARPPETPHSAPPAAVPDVPLPPQGEVLVVRRGERFTVAANQADPSESLAALAAEAGFAIEGGPLPGGGDARRIQLADVSALAALRALLPRTPFVAHFEPASASTPAALASGARMTLTRVSLGEPGAAARGVETAAEAAAAPSGDAMERSREDLDADEAERRAAVSEGWQDPRDSVRLEAIEQMDAEEDHSRLETLVREDPSPEVRAAAVQLLAEGNAFQVTETLIAALDDSDPGVVASAVRSLEDVYDEVPNPQIRERIAALRSHREADVRAAVEDFEEWIEP